MARITSRRTEMRINDYAVVRISHESLSHSEVGVVWRYDAYRYYFLTACSAFDGCSPCDISGSGFGYSWASIPWTSSLTIEQAIGKFYRNNTAFTLANFYPTSNSEETRQFESWWNDHLNPNATEDSSSESTRESEVRFEDNVFISDRYERDAIYRGQHHYHRHHGSYMNNPLRDNEYLIGVELEVEFGYNENAKDAFNSAPSNWFYRETDSSLGSGGVEIITVPLHPKDAKDEEFWKPLVDSIKPYARSWDTGRCGLHVHIGRNILGNPARDDHSEVIGKLLYFYHHCLKDTSINTNIYGRSHGYHEADGKTDTSRAADLLGASTVLKHKEIQTRVKDSLISRSHDERYFDINLLNSNTIEFRKGRGSIDTRRIVAIIEWSEIIVRYAKSTPWENISYLDFKNFLKAINIDSTLIKKQIELCL